MAMDGLFFMMSIVGIGLVMYWVATNDKVAPDKPTRGIFAMLEEAKRNGRQSRPLLSPAPVQAETIPEEPGAGRRHTRRP
jgi:hypothetical protein